MTKIFRHSAPLALLLTLACASVPRESEDRFAFSNSISPATRASVEDYRKHRVLPNGREYGGFVRGFRLRGRSPQEIRQALAGAPCRLKEDVIREPKKNQPILASGGKTTPLWLWSCEDGGVIRIKPDGDPTNKYRPQPHGSKALRYPAETELTDFAHETAKIDEEGNILPKWPADLRTKEPALINEWADRAHSDLGHSQN